jgi:hypothetical protein
MIWGRWWRSSVTWAIWLWTTAYSPNRRHSIVSRVAVRRGFKEAGLQYLDRAYRSYAAQGDQKRAAEELSKVVELVRESGKPEEVRRYEAELTALKATPARDDMKGRKR